MHVCMCGTGCRGRFVSHWPCLQAALFSMQICRCGVLSPLMECESSTVNLNPQQRCNTNTHTYTHLLCIFSASQVTSLLTTCSVLFLCSMETLFLTLQTLLPGCNVFHPVKASMPNECRELGGLAFKCYLFSIRVFFFPELCES